MPKPYLNLHPPESLADAPNQRTVAFQVTRAGRYAAGGTIVFEWDNGVLDVIVKPAAGEIRIHREPTRETPHVE